MAPTIAHNEPNPSPQEKVDASVVSASTTHDLKFWGSFVALCLLSFVSALDVAVITTALPTITKDIGGEKQYVWIANSFVLASAVPQPLFGQLANIFGRRLPLLMSTTLFALGSGIAGGANGPGMLIGGRSIQGVGAGGIYVLLDIICCDLVPLRQRGKYLGLMFSWAGLGAALGPVIGGALAQADWRWIFYMNIPICGIALGAVLLFFRVTYTRSPTWKHAFGRIDWIGNVTFCSSLVAVLYGLVSGGTLYPWSSWRVVVPLVLGVIGWVLFHLYQASPWCVRPSVPTRLFGNRTSAAAYLLTFMSSVIVQATSYFLPVYFQGVLGASPLRAGNYFLPYAIGTLVSAVVAGVLLSKLGVYRPLHAVAFTLSCIGFGLFTLLKSSTPKVTWVFYELIASAGAGIVQSVLLPAIMAALPESDVASASAAYSFLRTFGYVWGVALAAIIFNAQFNADLRSISSPELQLTLADGAAYAYASNQFIDGLEKSLKIEVIGVYIRSLKCVWWMGLAFSLLGLIGVAAERGLELRKDLDTEYGLQDAKDQSEEEIKRGEAKIKSSS